MIWELRWNNYSLEVRTKLFWHKKEAKIYADSIYQDYEVITLVNRLTGVVEFIKE